MRGSLIVVTSAILIAACLAGCGGWLVGSQPYQEVKYFALKTPEPLPDRGVDVNVVILRMLGPSRNKMIYRDGSSQVLIDDYNKWILPPGAMVRQYLQTSFSTDGERPVVASRGSYILSGSIVVFDIDLLAKQVSLGMDYKLSATGNLTHHVESSRIVHIPYVAQTPEAFAEAMSKAAGAMAAIIFEEAVNLDKRNLDNQAKAEAAK